MDINICVYFGGCILNRAFFNELQNICRSAAPKWSSGLHLWPPEDQDGPVNITGNDGLYNAIVSEVSTKGPLYCKLAQELGDGGGELLSGMFEFRGASKSLILIVTVDSRRFIRIGEKWLWGNSIALQVRRAKVDGVDSISWVNAVFTELCSRLDPWYGHAHFTQEYDAKNISTERGCTRAIGVDIAKSLPGLYWLNFFGKQCVARMGIRRVKSVPAQRVLPAGNGILIGLSEDPRKWDTRKYKDMEADVLAHLGKQFFYSRTEGAQDTVSPVFTSVSR
jgi:hypothetical protein